MITSLLKVNLIMNSSLKDIFLIFFISSLIGLLRSVIVGDIPLIKHPIDEVTSDELLDATLDGPKIIKF